MSSEDEAKTDGAVPAKKGKWFRVTLDMRQEEAAERTKELNRRLDALRGKS